ncbi:MAG: hypothetical protein Q7V63_06170 [Gammaproteobacteria bacterium]|nr:hypothetical protein [Gammaproteobacteria bacterium]
MSKHTMEIVLWSEIRDKILAISPDIGQVIEQYADKDQLKFVRARFPYGVDIEKLGELWFSIDGKSVNYKSDAIPTEIKQLLDYPWSGFPVSLMTHNTIESFIELPSHIIPLRVITPGTLFSLNSIFNPNQTSHVMHGAYSSTSGSRSLLMLPKISHGQYNERLAKVYHIDEKYLCPKTFSQQWDLFNALANSSDFDSEWYSEIVLFSKETISLLSNFPDLKYSLLKRSWDDSAFARNQVMYDLVWSIFTENLPPSIRNTPFIIEAVKHLIKLAMREAAGFAPVMDDSVGPVRALTDVFLNVYRIRYYLPVFMRPEFYDGVNPIYYSLHKHTFFHPIPQRSNANRTIDEMVIIKKLVLSFKEQVLENKFPFPLHDTILYETLNSVEFEFFHPQGGEGLSRDITSISREDPRYSKLVNELSIEKDLEFPDHSIFFNGCIRIRPLRREAQKQSMKDFLVGLSTKKVED